MIPALALGYNFEIPIDGRLGIPCRFCYHARSGFEAQFVVSKQAVILSQIDSRSLFAACDARRALASDTPAARLRHSDRITFHEPRFTNEPWARESHCHQLSLVDAMPEPKSHSEHRNWIERILRHIPGFKGYLEKEYRRDSDALQRQYLADCLQRAKTGLDGFSRALADAGQLDQLPMCDRLRAKIDKSIGRIRGAMQGYSGFFDLVRVDEALLDRTYEYDLKLLEKVESFAEAVNKLGGSTAKPSEAIPPLLAQIDELDHAWNQRHDILKGLE